MDPSRTVLDDCDVQRWVLGQDRILVRAVVMAVGISKLEKLAAHFADSNDWYKAAAVQVGFHRAFSPHVIHSITVRSEPPVGNDDCRTRGIWMGRG